VHYALENIQRTRRRRQQQQQRVRFVHLRSGNQHPLGRRGPRHRRNHHPRDDVGRQAPATSTTKPPATPTKSPPPTPTTTSTAAAATEKVCRPVQELRQLARAGDERVSAEVVQRQHGVAGPAARPRTGRQLPTDVESVASAERHRRRRTVVSDAESGQRHADNARRRTGTRRRS